MKTVLHEHKMSLRPQEFTIGIKYGFLCINMCWAPKPYLLFVFLSCLVVVLCWCFTALRHFSSHFGHGQLTYPHCSWSSLLGSLPVLSAHSFASNWQLPFLNQQKGENRHRNYFTTNLHERMLPDVRIEPATIRIPGGRASDRATAPGLGQDVLVPDYCLLHLL